MEFLWFCLECGCAGTPPGETPRLRAGHQIGPSVVHLAYYFLISGASTQCAHVMLAGSKNGLVNALFLLYVDCSVQAFSL